MYFIFNLFFNLFFQNQRDRQTFVCECCWALHKPPRSSDLSQSRKELYQELVAGSASDPLVKRLDWSLEEIRISPRQLVLLDVGYIMDNADPPYRGEKCKVFLAILAVARMVIWQTQNKGL